MIFAPLPERGTYLQPHLCAFSAVAWFATMPNRRNSGIAMKYLQPLIQERIENTTRKQNDPTFAYEEPVRYISTPIETQDRLNKWVLE